MSISFVLPHFHYAFLSDSPEITRSFQVLSFRCPNLYAHKPVTLLLLSQISLLKTGEVTLADLQLEEVNEVEKRNGLNAQFCGLRLKP